MTSIPNPSEDVAGPLAVTADAAPVAEAPSAPRPSTEKQARLLQLFERGKKSLGRGDYNYAHDLFAQCVAESPGDLIFLQHFRANLSQIHPNATATKAGAFGALRSSGGAVAKAAGKGAWRDAFAAGCDLLKRKPGDLDVLTQLATSCGELGHSECELYYLRWALDLAPDDVGVNQQAAAALERIGEYDQAIACWTRVQQQRPSDQQPEKEISRLSVEKTIDRGGYDPKLLDTSVAEASARVDSEEAEDAPAPEPPKPANEESLRNAIEESPWDPQPYLALANLYLANDRLQDTETLLRKAFKVSNGSVEIEERVEEVYVERMRRRALDARRRADEQPSEIAENRAKQLATEANQAEVEVYTARTLREPGDPRLQLELGLRLKRVGRHRDAIGPLQVARDVAKRTAEVEVHLGECFQHIQQHQLALRSYEAAIAACGEADWTDVRKLAHYRAGVLAFGMRDIEKAERWLTELAAADFGYRDVSQRLDKIAAIRNDS